MAPKAKAKVAAKAKAGGRILLRRPAALPGGRGRAPPRRRPAGVGSPGGGETPWKRGEEVVLREVALEEWDTGQRVILSEADYCGLITQVAGRVRKIEKEDGELYVSMALSGTKSEQILQVQGTNPTQLFVVHVCPTGCALQESGDHFLHGLKGRLVLDESREDPWIKNLEGAGDPGGDRLDELQQLRERAQGLAPRDTGVEGGGERPGGDDPGGDPGDPGADKEKSKKKKKKKEKDKKSVKPDGKRPMKCVQKNLQDLFGGTGLDPRERVRKRVLKTARKYVAKKKQASSSSKTSSSSSEESSTSEGQVGGEGIFSEGNKARVIAEHYPGALCCEAIHAMRSTLMTDLGEEEEGSAPKPIAIKYYRQHLQKKASGAMSRDLLNTATALDHLLRGRPSLAADCLAQRLKSNEATLNGSHWSVAQRMELPIQETATITQRLELQAAHKENYAESRTSYLASLGGKGSYRDEKGKKGKGDGKAGKNAGEKGKSKEGPAKAKGG